MSCSVLDARCAADADPPRSGGLWAEVPTSWQVIDAALSLLKDTVLGPKLRSVFVRDATGRQGWEAEYQEVRLKAGARGVYTLRPVSGRIGTLLNGLRSVRSGDIIVVLADGAYLDDLEEYPGNHGGLSTEELRVPLVLAGPGLQIPAGVQAREASNTQVAATVYMFLTGKHLPRGAAQPAVPGVDAIDLGWLR